MMKKGIKRITWKWCTECLNYYKSSICNHMKLEQKKRIKIEAEASEKAKRRYW
jgi:putative lipase involved disintegration of autophagic bodies